MEPGSKATKVCVHTLSTALHSHRFYYLRVSTY